MLKKLKEKIENKKTLILGFGREGLSSYKLIRSLLPNQILTIADQNENLNTTILKEDPNINLILGNKYLDTLDDYDLILKTPGISLKDMKYSLSDNKLSSQTEIFLELFSKQIIGITGTKGKSTTSSLIFHIIKQYTDNVIIVGNIGQPPFNMLNSINHSTFIVYELSSHQLEKISFAPHISILLNLYQEHLDHYNSFYDYQLAKFNITKCQNEKDYFIYNADDLLITNLIGHFNLNRNYLQFSLTKQVENGTFIRNNIINFIYQNTLSESYNLENKRKLKGTHNLLNIMAAINACKILDIPDISITNGINSFDTLPHRIEFVGKFNNINYYNDSIATIPEATIQAIKTLNCVDTLILGGFDRGISYNSLMQFL
ncbi:MAG TPA: UDP-N-acetylmuramoyl-L-alanine--D-glutamate ligase, partial [Bacteroidales bacterium]|nr:UDP-N-acetylmuramoyl-L-alanine--D-glutamate ligase [Bacteroidales bacterium]